MLSDKEAGKLYDELNKISKEYNKLMKPIIKLEKKFNKIATKLENEGWVTRDIGTIQ